MCFESDLSEEIDITKIKKAKPKPKPKAKVVKKKK